MALKDDDKWSGRIIKRSQVPYRLHISMMIEGARPERTDYVLGLSTEQ